MNVACLGLGGLVVAALGAEHSQDLHHRLLLLQQRKLLAGRRRRLDLGLFDDH